MKERKKHVHNIFATILTIGYFVVGSIVSVVRYWQYDIWYYDFGIFSRALFNASRFKLPIIDHFIVPDKIIFADHFNPSLFILTPLYWITSRQEILLVAQALCVALSGYLLYKIGLILLKSEIVSLGVMISYFLFVGLQNAVITEFHELTVMTLFLMATYYFYASKKKNLFLLFFFITLGFKESLFLLGVGIGTFILFERKEWRSIGIFLIAYSVLYGLLTTKFIIPYFSGRPYYYFPGALDLRNLFQPIVKIKTLVLSFGSFLFLPLGALSFFPLYAFHFASRFLSDGSTRWDLGLHYSAEIAPTLAFGALLTLSQIQKIYSRKIIIFISVIAMVVSIFLFRVILHGPFLLVFNRAFYDHTKTFIYLDQLVDRIPENESVAAQNNLAVRFIKQRSYILRDEYWKIPANYIVMDMREGQNPNNFLGIKDEKKLLNNLLNDKRYSITFHKDGTFIFHLK